MPKLLVKANTTVQIDPTYNPVYLDELVMEDNSTIQVSGIESWILQSPRVSFGSGCRVLAKGADAPNASDQTKTPPTAAQGKIGNDGLAFSGDPGTTGGHGINLDFTWGIVGVGNLNIDTSGGNGGNGGRGGIGQQGGGATCLGSDGRKGGKGGIGGTAGAGGDAGIVNIKWYPQTGGMLNTETIYQQLKENLHSEIAANADIVPVQNVPFPGLTVSATGGRKGSPGAGGSGGRGGDGVNCGFYAKGGGPSGENGNGGAESHDGSTVMPHIVLIPSPIAERHRNAAGAS